MKVVRSKRLDNVLRDPKAAEQLRAFLASASLDQSANTNTAIDTLDANGKQVRYVPKLVRVFGSAE
ncbi:hypothetical protein [Trinickia fusca]|nr:hypothetical protein [Trinickia fusca]